MRSLLSLTIIFFLPAIAQADFSSFTMGPEIEDFGPVADVDITWPVPEDTAFRHSFDVTERAEDGQLNQSLVSAARFINQLARIGVDADRVDIAVIVHGGATFDVSGHAPANADLVATLLDHGVKIIVCGQSAAYYDVKTDDLFPGVEVAISAMAAHAFLQRQGYTLNPF